MRRITHTIFCRHLSTRLHLLSTALSQHGLWISVLLKPSRVVAPFQTIVLNEVNDLRKATPESQWTIWKLRLLVSVPLGVVTTTGPVVARAGTTAVM